ncbi:hypothetical protein pipiens_012564 [Culex pipiens pipiens]|uniref:Uncharacterized protein n=1 Tax=Culex pipiens pipiens TaxID=38569 RepID=A0ABD1D1W1_CULPP
MKKKKDPIRTGLENEPANFQQPDAANRPADPAAQYDQERERHSTTSTDNPVSVEVNYGGGAIPGCVNVSTPLDPGMQSALMPGTLTIVPHRTSPACSCT